MLGSRSPVLLLLALLAAASGCAPLGEAEDEEGAAEGAEANLTTGGYVEATVATTNLRDTFEASGAKGTTELAFTKTAQTREVDTTWKGKGHFADAFAPPRDAEHETVTSVPGKDKRAGHSRLTLTKILGKSKRATLAVDEVIERERDGVTTKIPLAYRVEVAFLRGSWMELLAGAGVELEVTANGMREVDKARQLAFQAVLKSETSGLIEKIQTTAGGKVHPMPIVIDRYEAEGRLRFTGTKDKLESADKKGIEVKMHMSVAITT